MSRSGSKSKSTTTGSAAPSNANRKKEPATQDCPYQVPRNWTQLQREGWTFREGLPQFVYVRPDGPDPKSGRAKLGVDYFRTPGDMVKHCEATFQLNRALKRKKKKEKKGGRDPTRRVGKNTKSSAAATKKRKEQSKAPGKPKHAAAAAVKNDETTNGNLTNTAGGRREQLRAIIRPEMDWAIVWPTLKDNGWVAKPGRGLVS